MKYDINKKKKHLITKNQLEFTISLKQNEIFYRKVRKKERLEYF